MQQREAGSYRLPKATCALNGLSTPLVESYLVVFGGGVRFDVSARAPASDIPNKTGESSGPARLYYERRAQSASSLPLSGTHHVFDGDATSGPRALNLGEVHAKLLGLLHGGVRGVRLFLGGLGLVLVLL
jgi:hypothetical protein